MKPVLRLLALALLARARLSVAESAKDGSLDCLVQRRVNLRP